MDLKNGQKDILNYCIYRNIVHEINNKEKQSTTVHQKDKLTAERKSNNEHNKLRTKKLHNNYAH